MGKHASRDGGNMINSALAIFGSILLGVLSNILTPFIIKYAGKYSNNIKQKAEAQRIIFERTIQYVIENPVEELILRQRYTQRGLTSLITLIFGMLLFAFGATNIFLFLGGIPFIILGYIGYQKADRLGRILAKVHEHKT